MFMFSVRPVLPNRSFLFAVFILCCKFYILKFSQLTGFVSNDNSKLSFDKANYNRLSSILQLEKLHFATFLLHFACDIHEYISE